MNRTYDSFYLLLLFCIIVIVYCFVWLFSSYFISDVIAVHNHKNVKINNFHIKSVVIIIEATCI